jgi:hypothetical protein
MTIPSAASHTGMYRHTYKLATVRFEAWGTNKELATALPSSVLAGVSYVAHRRGRGSLNHGTTADCRLLTGSCDGVRLPSQHCDLGPVVLSPDDNECEPVSRRYRLGLAPILTTRALWPSPERGQGNENLVSPSPWVFKISLTCHKILRHGTFRFYFPSQRKVCCGFLSPLKIRRLSRVRTHKLWIKWQAP